MNSQATRLFLPIVIALQAACGGGGGSGSPSITSDQALEAIQKKLDDESNKLIVKIISKVQESSSIVGSLTCAPMHIDLAETMVKIEIMQGLDEFNRWVLAYEGATSSIKYEIGLILDRSMLATRSEQAFYMAIPCSGIAVTKSANAVFLESVYEVINVRESLRTAGLLAP